MSLPVVAAQVGGLVPRGTQQAVFDQMFWVFTVLGAVVGALVIGYLLWKAYQYRASAAPADDGSVDRPRLGELPARGEGGRHLLFSFSLSGIIVVSLIVWTYGGLLYVEQGVHQNPPAEVTEHADVTVVGHQFYWEFRYTNVSGHSTRLNTTGTLRVPKDALIEFRVTSADVFHTFGVPGLKVKTDAIPGQTTSTWLVAHDEGSYTARCYELCGRGHSYMTANVTVMEQDAFDRWYANQTATTGSA
ncbi:MAG: cytochrome c oxidase subunit II [Halobacteriaceae archaeon]